MKKSPNVSPEATELRPRAGEKFARQPAATHLSRGEADKLLHELQGRLFELEAQNKALIAERAEVEGRLAGCTELYDSALAGYFTLDPEGSIRQTNQTGARILGCARTHLVGQCFLDFVAEESRPVFNAFLARAFAEHGREACEVRLIPSNECPSVVVHIEGIADAMGVECHLAVTDITGFTEPRRMEEVLRRFAVSTIDVFSAQICILDETGKIVAVNQSWRYFYDEDFPAKVNFRLGTNYLSVCNSANGPYSEEAKPMAEGIRSVIRGERDAFMLEFPCHRTDEQRWFIARVIRFPGDRRHVFVVHENITERKCAEEGMQLAEMVYQTIGEAIMVADADNRIIAVNPAFTQRTGYSAEEAIGKSTNLLKSGRQGSAFYRQMWHSLTTTGHWQGEIWNRRKNGEIYSDWLVISTYFAQNGSALRRVAMYSDINKHKLAEAAIWRQANYDPLTDLPNRNLFYDRLQQELLNVRREGRSLALMFIDLDHFKEVNDKLGHHIGDQLLIEVARRIGSCVRETDTLARLGGDEFTVILPGLTDASRIEQVAQQIIDAVTKPFLLGQEIVHVSASIGITLYPEDAADIENLLRNADLTMYAAKAQGRNRYNYFTAAMQRAAQARRQLGNDLRRALAADELMVYYQPIISLGTGKTVMAEALLRWWHPTRGIIEPSELIPLAEEIGLINEIGYWIFREAARQAKRWREINAECIQVTLNKSPRQFLDCKPYENWIKFLQKIGLPASCIMIEISEGLLLDDRPEVTTNLLQFRNAGVRLIVDDFGSGYSAMSYLKKFRIDFLKIDKHFVVDMASNPNDRAIVEAIIAMAHKLGIKVIAEGVETIEQHDLLVTAGCDFGQGFLFARPMPADEMNIRLASAVRQCVGR